MKLERLSYDAGSLVDFYEEGLSALGALCERTWHDRLEIVAEGAAARLWNPEGALQETELVFAPGDVTTVRDASREVFPGSPLTFQLAEALRPQPLPLEKVVLAPEVRSGPPEPAVVEKLWRAQFPETARWRLTAAFKADFHFSLVVLMRCEVQAIDQHWSVHRLAVALPGGEPDPSLAADFNFARADSAKTAGIVWPGADAVRWGDFLRTALEADLAEELGAIGARQESYLRRELDRIDDYFRNYEMELSSRERRSSSEAAKLKTAERLAAARDEHVRRRADQVARHEIRVQPHIDAMLLVAEPAWRASLSLERGRVDEATEALFVPRSRRWHACR